MDGISIGAFPLLAIPEFFPLFYASIYLNASLQFLFESLLLGGDFPKDQQFESEIQFHETETAVGFLYMGPIGAYCKIFCCSVKGIRVNCNIPSSRNPRRNATDHSIVVPSLAIKQLLNNPSCSPETAAPLPAPFPKHLKSHASRILPKSHERHLLTNSPL